MLLGLINACALIATSDDKMDDWCFIAGTLQLLSCSGLLKGFKQMGQLRGSIQKLVPQVLDQSPALVAGNVCFLVEMNLSVGSVSASLMGVRHVGGGGGSLKTSQQSLSPTFIEVSALLCKNKVCER